MKEDYSLPFKHPQPLKHNNMKTTFTLLLLFILYHQGVTQSISPSLIANAGSISYSGDIKLDWAVGELAVQNHPGSVNLTEGFFQGFNLTTSVFNVEEENNIKLYPNPTLGLLNIESSTERISKIDIYNLLGEQVYKQTEFEDSIDIERLQTGTYFLYCHFQNGGFSIHKIIKL
jgi:hypothetical protein